MQRVVNLHVGNLAGRYNNKMVSTECSIDKSNKYIFYKINKQCSHMVVQYNKNGKYSITYDVCTLFDQVS